MFNISVFEVAGCGDAPDQGVDNGLPGWRVGVAAGVPCFVLLLAALVLVRQNLEALARVVESLDNAVQRLLVCLTTMRGHEEDVEMGTLPPRPSAGLPRNLSDDEVLSRQAQQTQVWI